MEMSGCHPFRSEEARAKYLAYYDARAALWPVDSHSREVDTSYGQTYVRISGSADAPPLVLLPGVGSNSLTWFANIADLSAPFRTYAVDNIYDYGRSVYTRPIKQPVDLVNWLDDLFTALELGNNVNLLGLSYGGWIASQYALHHPRRLKGMVLLAPGATVLPVRSAFKLRMLLSYLPYRYFAELFVRWLLGGDTEISRLLVERAATHMILARRCFKRKRYVLTTVLKDEELWNIGEPTLFVVGEKEKLYSAHKAVQRLNQVAPNIKTVIIPDAGHDLTVVQAKQVNREIISFLQEVS